MTEEERKSAYAKSLHEIIDNKRGDLTWETVAGEAGLSVKALTLWRQGTSCPQSDNAVRALKAVGLNAEEAVRADNDLRAKFSVKQRKRAGGRSGFARSVDQPVLQDPPRTTSPVHYATRSVALLGRGSEKARLDAFVADSAMFSWMQISGEGGQGKSRLALELMRALRPRWADGNDDAEDEWAAGFLMDSDVGRFEKNWETWQPDRPHLLIVDYVIGRGDVLGPVFRTLCRRRATFKHPVRLLFVERQSWSLGTAVNVHRHLGSTRDGTADWFAALCDRHDGADAAVADARFDDGVVHLTGLSGAHLVEIARQAVEIAGSDSKGLSDGALIDQIGRIDASGRPLYAFLFGSVLTKSKEQDDWTSALVLDAVLDSDWLNRWSVAVGGQRMPILGEDHPALSLAVLATMCDGIDYSNPRSLPTVLRVPPPVRHLAAVITDTAQTSQLSTPRVQGMLPDILGEWFVLRCLRDGVMDIEEVTETAWNHAPGAMSRFVSRLGRDFPTDPVTLEILSVLP